MLKPQPDLATRAKNRLQLAHVIEHFGNKHRLAVFLGVSRQAVNLWKRIPLKHVGVLAVALGVPEDEIRADAKEVMPSDPNSGRSTSSPDTSPAPAPLPPERGAHLPDVRKTWPF